MKYYGKKSLASFIDIVLSIILLLGVFLTIYTYYKTLTNDTLKNHRGIFYLFLLTIGIICTFIIIIELKRIIKTLVLEDPFINKNINSLKRISNSCFIISALFIINIISTLSLLKFRLLYINLTGIHTNAEFFIFLLAGCFIRILSKVFEKAVKYKEENDLTI